jgi:hypothetical protein
MNTHSPQEEGVEGFKLVGQAEEKRFKNDDDMMS